MKNFRMTWKLVYEVYMTHLLSCVNFIKIDQVVFKYSQLKVSNLLKSRNSKSQIIYDKTKHGPMFPSNKAQQANEKVQVITVINESL